jgi:hypothetical protein
LKKHPSPIPRAEEFALKMSREIKKMRQHCIVQYSGAIFYFGPVSKKSKMDEFREDKGLFYERIINIGKKLLQSNSA